MVAAKSSRICNDGSILFEKKLADKSNFSLLLNQLGISSPTTLEINSNHVSPDNPSAAAEN